MLEWNLEFEDKLNGERVGEEVGGDIQGSIGEIKSVDIDADFVCDGEIPSCFDRVALKYACQHVGCALAPNDSNHDQS